MYFKMKKLVMMIINKWTIVWAFLLMLSTIHQTAFSQEEIQREVRVVKPYNPTLSESQKINILPEMYDTVKVQPNYNYSITPRHFPASYELEQIKPARMVGLPLEKLYKSQVTFGLGNYISPLAELHMNQLRSRNTSASIYLRHHSSGGKVKLDNDEKVFAGFSDNNIALSGKKFFSASALEGRIYGDFNRYHYYGYNTEAVDTILNKDSIRVGINSIGTGLKYYSTHTDSSRISYQTEFDYNFTGDRFENSEHGFHVTGNYGKNIIDQYVNLKLAVSHFQSSASLDSLNDNTIVSINPSIGKRGEEWMFSVGVNTTLDVFGDDVSLKLYPKAKFEFHIVRDVLIPYMGIEGYRGVNNYRNLLLENPFIVPGLRVKNSNYGMVAHAGIKGGYSSKMAFDVNAAYSMVEDMHFYMNDTSNVLGNQFIVEYDNARVSSLNAQVSWNHTEKLKFLLEGHLTKYELINISHPWHKPLMEIGLGASYNMQNKIFMDAKLFYNGKRYARPADISADPIILKAYPDANINIEYRYTKLLSFFLRFNNFSASRFDIWNQYPSQRFQLLGGFVYSL
jgi:hypothetical protein